MTKLLLAVHVLAAIVAVGPVTVAASMFPAAVRRGDGPALRTLHRICRVYSALGVVVPVFGLATAISLGVLGDAWLIVSIALTVLAAAVLGLRILPAQAAALTDEVRPAPATSGVGQIIKIDPTGMAMTTDARSEHVPATAGTPLGDGTAHTRTGVPEGDISSGQSAVLVDHDKRARAAATAKRLGMVTGVFNLLWATVVVLMIVRPGSTTGV